jgi:hypothetical protein
MRQIEAQHSIFRAILIPHLPESQERKFLEGNGSL